MSLTNRYDPSNPNHKARCQRTKCADLPAHPGGRHLDQRDELYDGPGGALGVASVYIRDSARKIISDAPALMPEVMDLVTYCDFMRDQVAHVQVDKDRSVRAASARALDCEAHGEVIKGLEDQVSAIDASAQRNEKARLALLGFLQAVDDGLDNLRPDVTVAQLVAALRTASKKAHAAHTRAWSS
jgi:hypothetical protein